MGKYLFSGHYIKRSMERSQSGGVVSLSLKKIRRMLRDGRAKVIKKDSGGKRIKLPTGEVIVVDKNFKKVITYFGSS